VEIIEGIVSRRAASDDAGEDRDLLDVIMAKVGPDATGFTAELASSLVVSMLFAAHDTQSTSLAWAMTEAVRRADQVEAIRAELHAHSPDGAALTFDDLRSMVRTEGFLKESLRVHPTIPFLLRRTEVDFAYESFTIPAGHYIAVAPAVSHLDAELFADPESFDPDRYSPERAEDRQLNGWLAFGAGRHRCVGAPLALLTMKVVLARLLDAYDWSPIDTPVPDYSTMISPPLAPCRVQYARRT
jgi:sterol 14-demethylase